MRMAQLTVLALLATSSAPNAFAASALEAPAAEALKAALADEHHAEALYAAVLKKFGDVRPFSNIIEAERMHAHELEVVMAAYGMTAEAKTLIGSKEIADAVPATIEEACQAGAAAEVANRDLYGPLIEAAGSHADIVAVFKRLQQASENNHLPAFQALRGGPRRRAKQAID